MRERPVKTPGATAAPSSKPADGPRYPSRAREKPKELYTPPTAFVSSTAEDKIVQDINDELKQLGMDPNDPDVPANYSEAISSPASELWQRAMVEEIAAHTANGTWDVIHIENMPLDSVLVGCRWVYAIKRDPKGNIERFKARLVGKGYMQVAGKDFDDVYASVTKHGTLRALLALAAERDWEIQQLDVKTAFLQADLHEPVYMKQPEGFDLGGPDMICHLKKALYGLKQAPRAWQQKLHSELSDMGFKQAECDPSLWILRQQEQVTYIGVYVDDMVVIGKVVDGVKKEICTRFDARDLGDAHKFVGLEIIRDRVNRTLKITQQGYTQEILATYGMSDATAKTVPMNAGTKLSKEGTALDTARYPYAGLVGSLLYLSICTRPDIAQAVGALARHMAAPTLEQWIAAKHVLKYLKGTAEMGLNHGGSDGMVGYVDADYAGDINSRRSTTGYVFILNGGAVTWQSKLQPTVANSTTEAEYMAAGQAVREALWLRKLMQDLCISDGKPVRLLGDNQAALKLIKNPMSTQRSKHIDVTHHFVRERVARKEAMFEYCQTAHMVADCLTKAVNESKLILCRNGMGVY
jgi:hypothetical protein